MPTPTPTLTRLTVSETELAGMLATAGLTPSTDSALPQPAATPGAEPGAEQREILRIAATPHGTLRIAGPGPERGTATTVAVRWLDPAESFVVEARAPDGYDFALVANRPLLLAWLDRTLTLTALPAETAGEPLELDLPAYAALLALADLVTDTRLREQLDRQQRRLPPPGTEALDAVFATGLATDDDRWAVSGARLACPVHLGTATGRLGDGVARLRQLGLVAPDAIGLTREGALVVSSLACEPRITALSTAVRLTSGIDVAHLTLHRSPIAIHLAVWTSLGDDPRLVLHQLSGIGMVKVLDGLIVGRVPEG